MDSSGRAHPHPRPGAGRVCKTLNMARQKAKIGLAAFVLVTLLASVMSPANAASVGGKCTRVGAVAKTKNVSFVCVKSGKKLVWQKATTKNATTKTTTTTTIATEKYIAPTTTSASTDDCKLIENSVERNRYNAIFAAFPAIGGNFEPTGTFKVALVPIDWADLPGEPNPLARATDQMKIFTEWFDTVTEGKVKFVWSA